MNVILEHPAEIEQLDKDGTPNGKLIPSSEYLILTGYDVSATFPTVRTRGNDRIRVEKTFCRRDEKRVCTGSWVRVNPNDEKSPQSVFLLEPVDVSDGRTTKLALRCQHAIDQGKIASHPKDQRRTYTCEWTSLDSLAVIYTPSAAEVVPDPVKDEMARLMSLTQPDLRVEAARKHVKWDADASLQTMVKRIAEAPVPAAPVQQPKQATAPANA